MYLLILENAIFKLARGPGLKHCSGVGMGMNSQAHKRDGLGVYRGIRTDKRNREKWRLDAAGIKVNSGLIMDVQTR